MPVENSIGTSLYSSQNGVEVTFQNFHSNLRNLYHFSVCFFDSVCCACMHSSVCVSVCACIHANVCMYSCACICVRTCVCMWMYLCASVVYTPLCVCTLVCVLTHSLLLLELLILYPTCQTLGLQARVRMPRFPCLKIVISFFFFLM